MRRLVLAASIFSAPLAAQAQDCPDGYSVPAEYSAWADPQSAPANGKGQLEPGAAYDLVLVPSDEVAYRLPPERRAQEGSFGQVAALHLERAGTYRIALDKAAWIDVVSGGTRTASTAHGHGPACSGIRKIVDFELAAGDHAIQLSGSPDAQMRIMVTRIGS